MLRSFFVALSQSESMRRFVLGFGPARNMSRRFVAGETLDEAILAVRDLAQMGIVATLDHLGENVTNEEDARRTARDYLATLERIAVEGLDATISVKPTHVGLDFGADFCYEQLRTIIQGARELGLTVEVDMEGSEYTQTTMDIFHRLLDNFSNVRLALQTYLYRTRDDLKGLIERGSSVRLCKGAYDEPVSVAWQSNEDVDAQYAITIDLSFGDRARETGFYPAFGTHDHVLIYRALELAEDRRIPKEDFEFQMLYGIRRDWQQKLAGDGYRVRIYVPFGAQWYPYFMRRLGERPANVLFIIRAMFGK
jgi:proline dehydrogenase